MAVGLLSIFPLQEEDERGTAVLLTRSFADKDGRGFREIRCSKIVPEHVSYDCQPRCLLYKTDTEEAMQGLCP